MCVWGSLWVGTQLCVIWQNLFGKCGLVTQREGGQSVKVGRLGVISWTQQATEWPRGEGGRAVPSCAGTAILKSPATVTLIWTNQKDPFEATGEIWIRTSYSRIFVNFARCVMVWVVFQIVLPDRDSFCGIYNLIDTIHEIYFKMLQKEKLGEWGCKKQDWPTID